MIWPARVWQPTTNGKAASRPVTDRDDARRQAVEAEIRERRENRVTSPDCKSAAGAR